MSDAKDKRRQENDFITMLLGPTLFGKACMLYFGLMYSAEPGQGWGWALAGSVSFTAFMVGRFLWRNRHYED